MSLSRGQSAVYPWRAPPSGALAGPRLLAYPGSSVSFRETPTAPSMYHLPSLSEVTKRQHLAAHHRRAHFFHVQFCFFITGFVCVASFTERGNPACVLFSFFLPCVVLQSTFRLRGRTASFSRFTATRICRVRAHKSDVTGTVRAAKKARAPLCMHTVNVSPQVTRTRTRSRALNVLVFIR